MTTALSSAEGFVVRPADEDDLNYVRKTWMKEHAESSGWIDAVGGGTIYFREHPLLRDDAMNRGAVTIACRPNVSGGICGFAVTESLDPRYPGLAQWGGTPSVVHFVYVKPRWRGMGVAKLLLAPLLEKHVLYTHQVRSLRRERLPEAWIFNPYPFLRST